MAEMKATLVEVTLTLTLTLTRAAGVGACGACASNLT
jgi:hypothetical protein